LNVVWFKGSLINGNVRTSNVLFNGGEASPDVLKPIGDKYLSDVLVNGCGIPQDVLRLNGAVYTADVLLNGVMGITQIIALLDQAITGYQLFW